MEYRDTTFQSTNQVWHVELWIRGIYIYYVQQIWVVYKTLICALEGDIWEVYMHAKSLGTQNKTYYIYSLPISVFRLNFAYLSIPLIHNSTCQTWFVLWKVVSPYSIVYAMYKSLGTK